MRLSDAVHSSSSALPKVRRPRADHPAASRFVRAQEATRVMRRTTKIRVLGQIWRVPRGFGRVYRDAARDDLALVRAGRPGAVISSVIDLLALVGYAATREQVADWDLRRRVEAVVWAATEHARASDNPVQRHPMLPWLPEDPWRGPARGDGALRWPTGTPISTEVTS
jgi:hypothetical protein